jgi:hypothetical protein
MERPLPSSFLSTPLVNKAGAFAKELGCADNEIEQSNHLYGEGSGSADVIKRRPDSQAQAFFHFLAESAVLQPVAPTPVVA